MAPSQISHKFHSHVHLKWDNTLKPILTVASGAEVTFDLADGGYNQFKEESTVDDFSKFNFALSDPAMGPVFVEGAEPGDVLKIELLDLVCSRDASIRISKHFQILLERFTADI